MMGAAQTIAATFDGIAAWVESEVAPDLEYLVPPPGGAVEGLELEWAHPSVFQMFIPPAERLRDGERQVPSIAVQLMSGADELPGSRELSVRLSLTVWAPGHFADGAFMRGADGWRDLLNGLGAIVSAVESAETIAGCAVDMGAGVQYGLYALEEDVPDPYSHWAGHVDFRLVRAPQGSNKYKGLL